MPAPPAAGVADAAAAKKAMQDAVLARVRAKQAAGTLHELPTRVGRVRRVKCGIRGRVFFVLPEDMPAHDQAASRLGADAQGHGVQIGRADSRPEFMRSGFGSHPTNSDAEEQIAFNSAENIGAAVVSGLFVAVARKLPRLPFVPASCDGCAGVKRCFVSRGGARGFDQRRGSSPWAVHCL